MRKRFALILAACLLAQSCPYVVTAEPVNDQEISEDVEAPSEESILSGDCSGRNSHVEWKVVKTDDDEKLKLLISGNGQMKDYTKDDSLIHPIDLELDDLGIDDAYISEIEICEGVTSIGSLAFCDSKIEKVVLPDGLKKLDGTRLRGAKNSEKSTYPIL